MSRYTRATHTVLMSFAYHRGWQVQFVEPGLQTPFPRRFTFSHADKLREIARRGEALGCWEHKRVLELAIEKGRGEVYLRLSPQQYARLARPARKSG